MLVRALVGKSFVSALEGKSSQVVRPVRLLSASSCGGFIKKFLKETGDQSLAIKRLATHIGEGREFSRQHRQRFANSFRDPKFAHHGLFSLPRAKRHRGNPSVSQPRLADDALRIQIDSETRRHGADVHLAPFRHFVPFAFAGQPRT